MSKFFYFIFCLFIFSCNTFIEKETHEFVFKFEDEVDITNQDFVRTISVLKRRLDKFVGKYEIIRYQQKRIKIKFKANKLDTVRFNSLITNCGKLEFWELYKGEDFLPFLYKIDTILSEEKGKVEDTVRVNPLLNLFVSNGYKGGPVVFYTKKEDTAKISSFLNKSEYRLYLPNKFKNVKFLWGILDENNHVPLYAAKSNRKNEAPLTGECIIDAIQQFGHTTKPEVGVEMNKEGAITWARLTGKAFNNRSSIGITINNIVHSAPGVTSGPIRGGKSTISGDFTVEEAQDLATILSSQKTIPKLELLEHNILN